MAYLTSHSVTQGQAATAMGEASGTSLSQWKNGKLTAAASRRVDEKVKVFLADARRGAK